MRCGSGAVRGNAGAIRGHRCRAHCTANMDTNQAQTAKQSSQAVQASMVKGGRLVSSRAALQQRPGVPRCFLTAICPSSVLPISHLLQWLPCQHTCGCRGQHSEGGAAKLHRRDKLARHHRSSKAHMRDVCCASGCPMAHVWKEEQSAHAASGATSDAHRAISDQAQSVEHTTKKQRRSEQGSRVHRIGAAYA